MKVDLGFLKIRPGISPLQVLMLAANDRAAGEAVAVAARIKIDGVHPRVARHLFADADNSTDWSILVKETVKADGLIVSFGDECAAPDRLRTLVDYASRMRSDHFSRGGGSQFRLDHGRDASVVDEPDGTGRFRARSMRI